MQSLEIKQVLNILKNNTKNISFLDIRKRKEYVYGFAFGSVNCPFSKFKYLIKELVPDINTTLILIGVKNINQKNQIQKMLKKLKYHRSFIIKGDYKIWKKYKFPIWAGEYTFSKAFGEWIEITSTIKNLYAKELYKIHNQNHNYLQIDARPKKEFEKFSLPQSVQCSGGELPCYINNTENLRKNYIVHCAGRTRSIIAYQTLKDFNFKNKKYVLNGGTQNWVLNGFDRKFKNQSKITSTKINYKDDLKLANSIVKKFKIPTTQIMNKKTNSYNFQINSEIKNFKKIPGWKQVNATTLIQSTDKFISSTNTKVLIFSNIPSSAVFTIIWLRRMGYQAIWQKKNARKIKKNYKSIKPDPTYFFPKRHLGSKSDSKGYLKWEHSLIPTIKKWGCKNPWLSANQKDLSKVQHSIYKIYKNF
ncbi:MAG: sulfurtransferase [Pelagibacteraceae bacterium]|nr:sulfurtransferase [Pelagibacteraceae bacterium]OUV89146.1 MAG: sulfurtransferase [Pelagibacteraceae bacterium TMED146]